MNARNWAGQTIEPGSVVWRGARDGNTSSFKIGVVLDVVVGGLGTLARVEWVAEQMAYGGPFRVLPANSVGRPSINSLCLVNPATLDLAIMAAIVNRQGKFE